MREELFSVFQDFKPVQKTSTYIEELIRCAIMTGRLKPLTRIPNENLVCDFFQVGRSTLREAFSHLEALGLLVRSTRGTMIGDKNAIAAQIQFLQKTMSVDARAVVEYRSIIEVESAHLAAQRADRQNLEVMENALKEMKSCNGDMRLLSFFDTVFHMEMLVATQNYYLSKHMSTIVDTYVATQLCAFSADVSIQKRACAYHLGILEAVKNRNPDSAREIMRKHIHDVETCFGK